MDLNSISALATIIGVIVGIISLWLIYKQIEHQTKTARAEFIFHLDNHFSEYNLWDTFEKFENNSFDNLKSENPKISPKEKLNIEKYLNFFSTLQFLLANKLIELDTIDKMFAYRFFVVMNNSLTSKIVQSKRECWEDLIELYYNWLDLRVKNEAIIPNKSTPFLPEPVKN